jgi:hypothetical protein
MLDNRYSRAAHVIAFELKTEISVTVDVSTPEQDAYIFRIMAYLNRYFGKYWIVYPGNGLAIIRKQGE